MATPRPAVATWVAVVAAGLLSATPASARPAKVSRSVPMGGVRRPTVALAVLAGEPTAAGLRYWMGAHLAGQVWVGGTWTHQGFDAAVDVLYGVRDFIATKRHRVAFDFTVGGGVYLGTAAGPTGYHCHTTPWPYCHINNDPAQFLMGLRVPLGFSVRLTSVPVEFFALLAPAIRLTPSVGPEVNGGLGVRYYL